MSSTHIRRHVRAPRERVYHALIDAEAVQTWMVPDGMTSQVHVFEGRQGGAFRISLTYETQSGVGKSGAKTDTYHGRFVELVPGARVVETMEFETDDPQMQGEMRVTFALEEDANGETEIIATHEGVPPGVAPSDNELGWSMSLAKLARLVEAK